MKKCIFLIPNPGNFSKQAGQIVIGSSTHIGIGIEQLSKYFKVDPFIIGTSDYRRDAKKGIKYRSVKAPVGENNRMMGVFRDLKALIKNNIGVYKTFRQLKKARPDFIFERSEYLNFQGIISARLLGVPHFYEANWVHYMGIRQFYPSFFNPIARYLEEAMYNYSTYVYFVGNQNLLLNLKSKNWSVIQNGISEAVIKRFAGHHNELKGDVINVCVLASLMVHHRMDILLDTLRKLPAGLGIKLHFIGLNFEPFLSQIPPGIDFEYLGPLGKDRLYEVLAKMHVAVISGGPFYSSFMKLYDYAAVKLAVICPDLSNLTDIFSENEILFFKNEDSDSLKQKLEYAVKNPGIIATYGDNIYRKVADNYTWEKIFSGIADNINQKIR